MNDLVVKKVDFNGAELMAVQDRESGKIHVGVSYICKGIGLSDNQRDTQVRKVQSDLVLKNGSKNLTVNFDGQVRDVLGVDLDYLPLWLAKIKVTEKMQAEQPDVAQRLIEYQLKAKDALANAFIAPAKQKSSLTPKERGAGDAASLIKAIAPEMRRNNTPQRIIMEWIYTTLNDFDLPNLAEDKMVYLSPYEQLSLTDKAGEPA